jgi:hypothetical protein
MSPRPDFHACADLLIKDGVLVLPTDVTPRRHRLKIGRLITRMGYEFPDIFSVKYGRGWVTVFVFVKSRPLPVLSLSREARRLASSI